MVAESFSQIVKRIVKEDPRYHPDAYNFVREALEFTFQKNDIPQNYVKSQHITGQVLLGGIREYALTNYGPLALTVLNNWKVKNCKDFGEIVFNLVDYGVLGKTEEDSIEDFSPGYDFKEAFQKPFEPKSK